MMQSVFISKNLDLIKQTEPDASDSVANIYAIHTSASDDFGTDPATRYLANIENDQVRLLKTASDNARTLGSECAGDVMFGEYLHAFEDTYGHRKADNTPIGVNSGWGHALQLHAPDHTYNEDFRSRDPETGDYQGGANWQYNEARTLEMEHEVFIKMSAVKDDKLTAQKWDDIKPFLEKFNAIHESSANTDAFAGTSEKVKMLSDKLSDPAGWNLKFVGVDGAKGDLNLGQIGRGGYDSEQGAKDRKDFLRYKEDTTDSKGVLHKKGDLFKDTDPNFEGTILP